MGRSVEKYELFEELGQGGMATVYRARDTRLDRDVAVKIMHPHLRAAKEAQVRFTREAKSVARLKHPNILEIYDYSGEDSPESYIATELLTGPTLRQFVEAHPDVPPEIAVCIVLELVAALAAAHAAGIVHRDVKPENVLLHNNSALKLADFGIAQMVDSQSFTATGQILGSPSHMAPEQIEGQAADARTDLFAVGTVLYLLLTGRLPFTGKTTHQTFKNIMDGTHPPAIRLRPETGAQLNTIVEKLLAPIPSDRYDSALSLAKDLQAFLTDAAVVDSRALMAAFFATPESTAATFRAENIPRLLERAEAAAHKKDILAAQDLYGRVLAIDEGNVRALAGLAALSRGAVRTRKVWAVAGTLGLLFVLGSVWLLVPTPWTAQPKPAPFARDIRTHTQPSAPIPVTAPVRVSPPQPPATVPTTKTIAKSPPRLPDRATSELPSTREVRFDFTPRNVSLSIDSGPVRAVGPSFQGAILANGPHTFRLVGAADCCEETTWTETLSPGRSPVLLRKSLRFKPARVYVVTNVPADVDVQGRVRGRSREVLSVPLDALEERLSVRLSAPGYVETSIPLTLRAGKLTNSRSVVLAHSR